MSEIKPDITIIGAGALGTNLALALFANGYSVAGVFNRTEEKAHEIALQVDARHFGTFPDEENQLGKVIFICVPDDQLKNTADRLVSILNTPSDKYFVHCSGAKSAAEIETLRSVGASIASFHPLQTFLKNLNPDSFRQVNIGLQGDEALVGELEKIAKSIGALPFKVSETEKLRLHIAAVFACNYMVSIAGASKMVLGESGNENNAFEKLFPLMEQTLKNIEHYGPENTLSGPIKRGDVETLRKHLESLGDRTDLRDLYQALGLFTVNHFTESGSGNEEIIREMIRLMKHDF